MAKHNHYLIHPIIYSIPYGLYSRFLYCCASYFTVTSHMLLCDCFALPCWFPFSTMIL